MRRLTRVLFACAALGVAACSGMGSGLVPDRDLYLFGSNSGEVDFGMSKARVQYLMGPPMSRLYEGTQEAWLWCQTSSSAREGDAYLTVYFYKSQVAGIHTYRNRAEGRCDSFFRRVEWLADPDKAIAARQRRRE